MFPCVVQSQIVCKSTRVENTIENLLFRAVCLEISVYSLRYLSLAPHSERSNHDAGLKRHSQEHLIFVDKKPRHLLAALFLVRVSSVLDCSHPHHMPPCALLQLRSLAPCRYQHQSHIRTEPAMILPAPGTWTLISECKVVPRPLVPGEYSSVGIAYEVGFPWVTLATWARDSL